MATGTIINENATNNSSRLVYGSIAQTLTPTRGSAYASYSGCYYYKIGTRVTVHLGMQGLTANTNNEVFTMPTGYRPYGMVCVAGTGGASYTAHAHATIADTGKVVVASADQYANITLEYDAFY